MLKNFLLLIATISLTVATLEAALRLSGIPIAPLETEYIGLRESMESHPHPFYPGYEGEAASGYFYTYKPDSVWATRYPGNERGYFDKDNKIVYRINSDGFRDSRFGPKKPGVFRIIAIGDSYTLGEGVLLKETFPKLIEKSLGESGASVEVFNLGVNGYGIRDESVMLEASLERYGPDMVVWGYGLNDISHFKHDGWVIEMVNRKEEAFFKSPLLIANLVQERIFRIYSSRKFIEFLLDMYADEKLWGETKNLLRKANSEAGKHNAKFLVVIFPEIIALQQSSYIFEGIHKNLASFLEAEGIPYIDMTHAFKQYGPEKLAVHKVDGHPNEAGHRLTADEILKFISSNKTIQVQ